MARPWPADASDIDMVTKTTSECNSPVKRETGSRPGTVSDKLSWAREPALFWTSWVIGSAKEKKGNLVGQKMGYLLKSW